MSIPVSRLCDTGKWNSLSQVGTVMLVLPLLKWFYLVVLDLFLCLSVAVIGIAKTSHTQSHVSAVVCRVCIQKCLLSF